MTDLIEKIRQCKNTYPIEHDGSYELVQETINAYAEMEDLKAVDYRDLNLVYLMTIGTWAHGIDAKKRLIDDSHLSSEQKNRLNELLDKVWENAQNGKYENSEYGMGTTVGMFGTGFNSFKGKGNVKKTAHTFISMCIKIIKNVDIEEGFKIAEETLSNEMAGMGVASVSFVLHCIRPFWFPIFNSGNGKNNIFSLLGIKLEKYSSLNSYISNCRKIKAFCEANQLDDLSYRVFDIVGRDVIDEESVVIDFELIKKYLKENVGVHYVKPDKSDDPDRMKQIHDEGQSAMKEVNKLGKEIIKFFSNYKFTSSNWSLQSQEIPHYFWIRFKNKAYVKSIYSISLSIVYLENQFKIRVHFGYEEVKLNRLKKQGRIEFMEKLASCRIDESYTYQYDNNEVSAQEFIKAIKKDINVTPDISIYIDGPITNARTKEIIVQIKEAFEKIRPLYLEMLEAIPHTENKESTMEKEISLNTILYGPPGTGKTRKSLIYAVAICDKKPISEIEELDYKDVVNRYNDLYKEERVSFTTFHQSYGYEDFIEGIRPNLDGTSVEYVRHEGVFKSFCNKARGKTENYVFIIDEINRGNISKIFGELITLIETSRREGATEEISVILPYSKEGFSVPKNVYILGTMNTADRSIALLDTALRRRFDFVEMMPKESVLAGKSVEGIELEPMLKKINERIEVLYDREHMIGHSYFVKLNNDSTIEDLQAVFENEIIPLLQEYFYDDYKKISLVLGDFNKAEEYRFIKAEVINDSLFGNAYADFDFQEEKYKIQREAFTKKESYIKIYK